MKKIVVIGAGPAGLSAALSLTSYKDCQVTVLEAEDCVGGIARQVRFGEHYADLGGHRFVTKNSQIAMQWLELMPQMPVRERVCHILYDNRLYEYPVQLTVSNMKSLGLVNGIRIAGSFVKAKLFPRKEISLEDFYINRFGKSLYELFFHAYTKKLCGVEPALISPKWGDTRVRGLSLGNLIRNNKTKKTSGHPVLPVDQFYYPSLGPGQMWEAAARALEAKGGQIVFHSRVKSLVKNDTGWCLTVQQGEALATVEADEVISTMPLYELAKAMQNLPTEYKEIAEGLWGRGFKTVLLSLDRLPDSGMAKKIAGDCWIYVQDTSVKMGRVQLYHNWSPDMVAGEGVVLGLEYFCSALDELWNMPDKELVELAKREAVKLGLITSETKVYGTGVESVKDAYPSYTDTFDRKEELIEYLESLPGLYLAGRGGTHSYFNMDAAMLSGQAAAGKVKAE